MFNTRADVDRHVQNCMKKINNEIERNLKCLAFAKLYLAVGEYEQARRYVATYLGAKPHSAEAQLVLGETLEKLGKNDAALEAYRCSWEIDPKQHKLLIKICELLLSNDVKLDQAHVKYYCDKAQSIEPHNPIVFNLKEKLMSSSSKNPQEITQLFLREIETRPNDLPMLGVRLLRHLLDNNLILEAYKQVLNFQNKGEEFSRNLQWYETVANVLVRYQRENIATNLTWEYWMLSISTLNSLVLLSLDERSVNIKSTSDCISAVFNFDQSLKVAAQNIQDCSYKQLTQEFLKHYRGQLCFHLATLIFKLAKVNSLKYKEASQMSLPLLFLAYHTPPPEVRCMWLDNAPENVRTRVQRWNREASYRCSQMGHILISASKDQQKTFIERTSLETSGYWQEKLFKKVFVLREQQNKITTSFFATSPDIGEITLRIPDLSEIVVHDEYAQALYPDSLHHYIWIGMNQNLAQFKLSLFDGLQYSIRNFSSCSAESLNVLDIQSFIYASVLCAQSQIEDSKHTMYSNPNKPNLLPAAVTDTLGTLNQSKWLTAAYKMYKNDYKSNFGEMRLILIKGIEVIRCTGNHGMDVKLLVLLARIFTERIQHLTKQSEIEFNSSRAEIFWKAALPILEKLKNNQVVSYATNKIFDFKSKEMSLNEILNHIDNGKLFIGVQLMKKKEYEKALQMFETLKDPYASFHQAQIYKTLAEEQTSLNKENVTSEMRSQRITLLSHVRDYLYLTLDRLRDPMVDKKHPLNSQIATEIEKIDRLLSRIDPDIRVNDCDGISDENSSYSSIPDHGFLNVSITNGISPKTNMPLRTENSFRREARPSPERLDAQIRQLIANRDTTMHNLLEQNRNMFESHRVLEDELRSLRDVLSNISLTVNDLRQMRSTTEELKNIKTSVDDLKVSVDELLQNFRTVTDMVYEVKKEVAELKKDANKIKNPLNDDDLYVLDEDYQDYGLNANTSNLNNLYSSIPNRMPGAALPNALYGAHPLYQMGYPVMPYLNYPQPNVLPFPPDQQAPGLCHVLPPQSGLLNSSMFSSVNQSLLPPQANIFKDPSTTASNLYLNPSQTLLTTTSIATSPIQTVKMNESMNNKAPPVNVVITSSDPLPTTKVTTSQILSVSIPPQHLKGASRTQPHSYQISLPSTVGTTVTAPSVMNQTPLPVTTKNLLANVSAPIYSAIPEKNAGLGIIIERSLTQSFNSSNSVISNVSEDDPCPDFKPIIPLPDEVPLTTGEEKEEVLFSEHAKLYRFFEKEWRERGTGTIKILHNKETNKIRILMRRDQIHKICANHFITPDMILAPLSERAYMWAAQDYADEVVIVEKLSVRFKTPTEAKKFYDAFEAAKKLLSQTALEKPQNILEQPQINLEQHQITQSKTPEKSQSATLGGFVFTSTPTFKPKEALPKPDILTIQEAVKPSPFASFSFVKTPSTTLVSNADSTSEPIKKVNRNTSKLSPTKTDGGGDADESHDEEFVPTAEFKPVVSLPALIEIKTGEENAEILFEHKAKLLRFDSDAKEWKERGVGVMKILKQDNIIRFVMRREQVHKVCCNHQLFKEMTFQKMTKNTKAVTWCAEDYSDDQLKREMFAIRFKTEDVTNRFLDVVNKCLEILNDPSKKSDKKTKSDVAPSTPQSTTKGFGDKFKPKSGSWSCKICYVLNEAKKNYCVACESPKNDNVPPKKGPESGPQFSFGVNMQFTTTTTPTSTETIQSFVFGQKPSIGSNFVFGQKLDETSANNSLTFSFGKSPSTTSTPPIASIPSITSTTPNTSASQTSLFDAFKPKPGSWECTDCLLRNEANALYCVACNAPRDSSIPKKEDKVKSVDLDTHGLTFKFGIQPQQPNTKLECNTTKSDMSFKFGATATTTTNSNDIKPLNLTTTTTSTTTPFNFQITDKNNTDTKNEQFVFGTTQQHGFEFTPKSPRRQSGGHGEEESDGSYIEEESDNIYFKPVIPMPEKVDVLTGEESEEVLYCHRAKLFRFRDSEWKERGVGDLKVLYSHESKKLRVVMRREQVLKICLNHVLTKDIDYVAKDDKTWLFAVADFSEGIIEMNQFCLRFKTADIAKDFKAAIDKALKRTEKSETEGTIEESDSDVEIVFESKVTKEEEEEAKRLGLPPKFFAYRQRPDCTCEQCKKEDEMFKEPQKSKLDSFTFTLPKGDTIVTKNTFDSTTTVSTTPATKTATKIFGAITGNIFGNASKTFSSSGSIFDMSSVNNTSTGSVFGSTDKENTSNLFGNSSTNTNIFGNTQAPPLSKPETIFSKAPSTSTPSPSVFSTTATTTTTSMFGLKSSLSSSFTGGNIFANIPDATKVETIKGSGDAPKFTSTTSTLNEESEPVLKFDSNLSFASLVNTDGPVKFTTIKDNDKNPFASLGAGSLVFASAKPQQPNDTKQKQSEEESTENVEDYDPHYEPIIPLPEAVTVTTGEEDETALFNERAKLYRFDGKEWKERGVGQLKILHHPQKNTYRFLLRREQVHKVVLNQLITTDLSLQPMTTSDKAWLWGGYNYAEEEPTLEKLAARFKTVELARKFYDLAHSTVELLKELNDKDIPATVETIGEISENEEHVSDEEVDEDDEDYEDDERSIMFAKSCQFSEQLPSGEWMDIGKRDIQVCYDSEFYGSRITVCEENGLIISNTLIGMNTNMTKNDLSCTWRAVEWADNLFEWKNLRVTFDAPQDADEFYLSYEEGVTYAKHSDIIDEIPTIASDCA